MILSICIRGPNGMVSTNHVVGVYKGMIIDGECCHARLLNEQNLHQACGDKAFFVGAVRGYLMLPSKSRLSLGHTSPDDRDSLSSVYKKINDNADTLCMIKTPTQNKIWKKKGKKEVGLIEVLQE